MIGEQVHFESIQSIGKHNTQIDLSHSSEGIYILTIKTSDIISNYKLILQKNYTLNFTGVLFHSKLSCQHLLI